MYVAIYYTIYITKQEYVHSYVCGLVMLRISNKINVNYDDLYTYSIPVAIAIIIATTFKITRN